MNILIELLKYNLNGKKINRINDNIDFKKLFLLAKRHSLGTLFYDALKDDDRIPAPVKDEAKQHYLAQVSQQISQDYYAEELFQKLREKNIKYMPLKGYVLRKLYPSSELRTSCDVDIFYDKTRRKEVEQILLAMDFKKEEEGCKNAAWINGNVTIEMHHELANENSAYFDYYRSVWERLLTKDGIEYTFKNEDFYIYFLVHAASHFSGGGFGVRTLLDIYVYNKSVVMDKVYLYKELEKIRLDVFCRQLEKITAACFENADLDEEGEFLLDYIVGAGTYGNSENSTAISSLSEQNSVPKNRRKYLIKTIFPPFKIMKSKYPILKKVPILYPFMWVWRWFGVAFRRRERIKATVRNTKNISESNLNRVQRILEITQLPM